ncbi:MAG TPA: STAS domain-containing protein [Candidatus Binatia bacterium]|jgi:anti-anti-sigma factor
MEIATQQGKDGLELVVSGRLDAYWADHLSKALDEAVRGGAHHLRVDMSAVVYMSSVGIRVVLRSYKETQRLGGSFAIVRSSDAVRRVLELAGLESLLGESAGAAPPAAAAVASQVFERDAVTFEVFDLPSTSAMRCRVVGTPEPLDGCRYSAADVRSVRFAAGSFGIGLGSFGAGFEDCRARFGEFLALCGAAAYLPTDGTNVPDVVVATRQLVPEVQVLYALVCEGAFSKVVRFEAAAGDAATLSELTDQCLDLCGCDTAAIALVAESAGLMGAALRRSPAAPSGGQAEPGAPFAFPQIRDWLSFTPERAFLRSLAVVAGVATRADEPVLRPFVRPLAGSPQPAGHFHAAAFSYRALAKGPIDLAATVESVFTGEALQGILHLIGDDRPAAGAGQSEFVRGACWIAPIREVSAELAA